MLEHLTEMLKGVLEGCVLELIGRQELYGYEITRKLRALGFTDIVEGTVYTVLLRLEKRKLIDAEKRPSDQGPPRKFYRINNAGRAQLACIWDKWEYLVLKITHLREDDNHAAPIA